MYYKNHDALSNWYKWWPPSRIPDFEASPLLFACRPIYPKFKAAPSESSPKYACSSKYFFYVCTIIKTVARAVLTILVHLLDMAVLPKCVARCTYHPSKIACPSMRNSIVSGVDKVYRKSSEPSWSAHCNARSLKPTTFAHSCFG